jgi:hypothetical protein
VTIEPERLDDDLARLVSSYHRLRWISLIALVIMAVLAVSGLGLIVWRQQQQLNVQRAEIAASCRFFRDIASLPVVATPPAKRPSAFSVTLVLDAYRSAAGRRCPQLPPLDASVRRWAAFYHIPVPLGDGNGLDCCAP